MLQGGMCFMQIEFAVLYDGVPVGKAEIIQEGLYYRISCRYKLRTGALCRLIARWHGNWENIGIPVPEADGFVLVKKIPVKKLPLQDVSIHLIPAEEDPQRTVTPQETPADMMRTENETEAIPEERPIVTDKSYREPVSEETPFESLHRLEDAKLETEGNNMFVVFDTDASQIEAQTHGTVIGAEDIGVDGGLEDRISEPV